MAWVTNWSRETLVIQQADKLKCWKQMLYEKKVIKEEQYCRMRIIFPPKLQPFVFKEICQQFKNESFLKHQSLIRGCSLFSSLCIQETPPEKTTTSQVQQSHWKWIATPSPSSKVNLQVTPKCIYKLRGFVSISSQSVSVHSSKCWHPFKKGTF